MYKFKINSIKFNDGNEFIPGALTIIVGPNNSGKSRVLKDIDALISKKQKKSVIVSNIDFELPSSLEELQQSYTLNTYEDMYNNRYIRGLGTNMDGEYRINIWEGWEKTFDSFLKNRDEQVVSMFREFIGSNFVTILGTEKRLQLITEKESLDEALGDNNLLNEFYNQGIEVEKELRQIVRDTFNIDIKLDFSTLRKLKFRVGESLDEVPKDPREARTIFEEFEALDEQGDGLKSFVATILAMIVGKKEIFLLDEPEAFLHPPQAMKLGEYIGRFASTEKQMFISTHSADLLKGIISQTQNLNIIRVDRNRNVTNIKILNSEDVCSIANDPLLSSSRVLEGIFYKGAVVVEADSDATFYHRIARQIRSSDDIHYTHAHNKQTVGKVMQPYKKLGVSVATIVDFDIIRDWHEFKNLLEKIEFTKEEINELQKLREKIIAEIQDINIMGQLIKLKDDMENVLNMVNSRIEISDENSRIDDILRQLKKIRSDNSEWAKYKDRGCYALQDTREEFNSLYNMCKEKGLFIVPVGELESWLTEYEVAKSSNKGKWIISALGRIPKLDADIEKQPWKFIQEIHDYLVE